MNNFELINKYKLFRRKELIEHNKLNMRKRWKKLRKAK